MWFRKHLNKSQATALKLFVPGNESMRCMCAYGDFVILTHYQIVHFKFRAL
jgi:hypothetical protein